MRVLICGVDGYLGWPLAQYLTARGHQVAGIDCYLRRDWVAEVGGMSITPIPKMTERLEAFSEHFGKPLRFYRGNLTDSRFVENVFRQIRPEAIVHLAEMPSAPFSMIDVEHAIGVHENNLAGTLNLLFAMRDIAPQSHLIKLGTMGEYGTPNLDIPEGVFTIEYRGRTDTLVFPRRAGSWYHQTKVHDSNNIEMACRLWGIRSTDIMQGVVYGTRIDEMGDNARLLTRYDVCECFGTAINRFCAQAVTNRPITPYGKGEQRRGFLPLRDSMQCLTLAIENPPEDPEYRVFNQFEEVYSINELARKVLSAAQSMGFDTQIRNIENPRMEAEEHYYNPDHAKLLALGYQPTHDMESELRLMLTDLARYKNRILARADAAWPDIHWSGERRPVNVL